jgi:hypothetical protein
VSQYPRFDPRKISLKPLSQRKHELSLENWLRLDDPTPHWDHPQLGALARRMVAARNRGRPIILAMGAHVLRAGVNRFLIDLLDRGFISHIALNGAGVIHDFELSLVGATTESVARYILTGEFGMWKETGRINDIVVDGDRRGLGLGEAVGEAIHRGEFPYKELSILAACCARRIPVTAHVAIGQDIIHQHPNFDGAATGEATHRDFLILAHSVSRLEGGVFLNYGTAVMGPEVYLKALSMARNVAGQEGREIRRFTTAVFDKIELTGDIKREAPKDNPQYYFRPWKTVLVRTVADGGESFYFQGDHRATVPALYRKILEETGEKG